MRAREQIVIEKFEVPLVVVGQKFEGKWRKIGKSAELKL